jgi:ribonuclease R
MVWKNGYLFFDQRFAYEEAQYIIETKDNTMPEEISIQEFLCCFWWNCCCYFKMDQLAKIFRRNRMWRTSFDKVEVKFNLNEEGEPEGVYFKVSKDANHLIEEFMLLANKKGSKFIGKQKFIYRIRWSLMLIS